MIVIMAFAMTGLFVGYLSLYLMQEGHPFVARTLDWLGFALGMLGLSAFGIYLGRFARWNSWDALLDPVDTVVGRGASWRIRGATCSQLAFSATFFAFSLVCYLIVYSFHPSARLGNRAPQAAPPSEKPVAMAQDLR
jgi:uncharacterized membrane protein